jgi:uncharacterized protein (DUF983 family)
VKISRGQAILRLLCPECREGKVFQGFFNFKMNPRCPVCGLKFEREPGYFLGSMYLSYALGGAAVVAWVLTLNSLTAWPFHWILISAALWLWLLTPLIFRYSRVAFMTFERKAFPD